MRPHPEAGEQREEEGPQTQCVKWPQFPWSIHLCHVQVEKVEKSRVKLGKGRREGEGEGILGLFIYCLFIYLFLIAME